MSKNYMDDDVFDGPITTTMARPALNHDLSCEQVTVAADPRNIDAIAYTQDGAYVYESCSSPRATMKVEWLDDAGAYEMLMCTFHYEHFMDDEVPSRDDIVYTYSVHI